MTQDQTCKFPVPRAAAFPFDSRWLLGLGAAVYGISFALPAVSLAAYPGDAFSGWDCARLALMAALTPDSFRLALFAAGLINPFTLAYLVLRVLDRSPKVRRALAILTLSFIPLSWFVIAQDLRIGTGHLAWVAGLLMILGPEARRSIASARNLR